MSNQTVTPEVTLGVYTSVMNSRKLTPKQTLFYHLDTLHHVRARMPGRDSRVKPLTLRCSLDNLQRLHAELHYRYAPNHWHGPTGNLGADSRPEGWYTGEWVNTLDKG